MHRKSPIIRKCMKAGIKGDLLKDNRHSIKAVQSLLKGETYLSSEIKESLKELEK